MYLDFESEFEKLWSMKLTVWRLAIGAFGTVTKALI